MNSLVQQHGTFKHTLWYAQLELGFIAQQNCTILAHRKHHGPVRVQKMLWPEKTGVCHAIIVHPPAGIAGGDHLSFEISVASGAHGLVTTPGAGKWYRSNQKTAFQHIHINVQQQGILEWLPQETMLFNGAIAHADTQIHLAESASFIGWDMLVLGRQARDEKFSQGCYQNQFQLIQNNQLLVSDSLRFEGNDRFLSSCLGMNGHAVMASFWGVPPASQRELTTLELQLDLIRELIMRMDVPVTLTLLDYVVSARYLGNDVRQCHDAFAAIRARLRRYWFDLDEEYPRIWRT